MLLRDTGESKSENKFNEFSTHSTIWFNGWKEKKKERKKKKLAKSIQLLTPISLKSILILLSYLCLKPICTADGSQSVG